MTNLTNFFIVCKTTAPMQTDVVVIIIDALRADRVGALDGRDLLPI